MQQRFGVAVGLITTLENKIAGSLEGDAVVEGRTHSYVQIVTGILSVDNVRHAPKCFANLILGADAVQQPVGKVLAGYAERGTIFHQADIIDVRYFGASDTLIYPAYDIAENALYIVVELRLYFLRCYIGNAAQWWRENVG